MEAMNSNLSITVFTPSGFRGYFTMVFDGNDKMMTAQELEDHLTALGYQPSAPGLEPGENAETVGKVCLRMHYSDRDQRDVPVIAFYSDNDAVEYKLVHEYMDSADDIAEFERVSGLRIQDMPTYDGSQFPKQTDRNAGKYLVAPRTPFQIVKKKVVKGEGENAKERNYLQRYITNGSTPTATSGNGTSNGQTVAWWQDNAQSMTIKPELDKVKAQIGADAYNGVKADLKASDYATPQAYLEAFRTLALPVDEIPF